MSLLLLPSTWAYFSLHSRDSSIVSGISYSAAKSQLLPIQESVVIPKRDPIMNRFLSPWTTAYRLDRSLMLGQTRQLSPGIEELFPYHEYHVLAIPTLGYSQHSLTFKHQAEFRRLAAGNKQSFVMCYLNHHGLTLLKSETLNSTGPFWLIFSKSTALF